MSVNTSEEYLDELLQAIEPIIYANQPEPEVVLEPEVIETPVVEAVDDTAGLLDNLMDSPSEEPDFSAVEEISLTDEENGLADLLPDDLLNAEASQNEPDVAMDDLLAALVAEEPVTEEALDIDAMLSAAAGAAESMQDSAVDHDADVKALLQQFSDDEDLMDIGDILERNDNNEAVEDSLLEKPAVELFQMEENAEAEEQKKESKGLFGFLKKKKDKKSRKNKEVSSEDVAAEESQTESVMELADEPAMEIMPETDFFGEELLGTDVGAEEAVDLSGMSLDDIFAEGDMTDIDALLSAGSFDEIGVESVASGVASEKTEGSNTKKSNKKETFFSKLFTMLTEEDEEEPKKGTVPEASVTGITDENETILEELSKEEKKKRKKEEKEQKKKEKEAKKKGKAS